MKNRLMLALASVLSAVAVPVYAQVPAEASAAVTGLITDAGAFIASLWPLVIAVIVGFIFMKLFKKGVGKAT